MDLPIKKSRYPVNETRERDLRASSDNKGHGLRPGVVSINPRCPADVVGGGDKHEGEGDHAFSNPLPGNDRVGRSEDALDEVSFFMRVSCAPSETVTRRPGPEEEMIEEPSRSTRTGTTNLPGGPGRKKERARSRADQHGRALKRALCPWSTQDLSRASVNSRCDPIPSQDLSRASVNSRYDPIPSFSAVELPKGEGEEEGPEPHHHHHVQPHGVGLRGKGGPLGHGG